MLLANELNHYLEDVYIKGHTSESLKKDRDLYNKTAEFLYTYCLERAKIHNYFLTSMNTDPIDLAGQLTMSILNRFDTILNCDNPNPAGYAAVSMSNSIKELGRENTRKKSCTHPASLEDLLNTSYPENAIIPSQEELYIQVLEKKENREKVLCTIDQLSSITKFQSVCFLTTNILRYYKGTHITPKVLAPLLDQHGLDRVAEFFFPLISDELDVPVFLLTDCPYRKTEMPSYTSLEDLRGKICDASFAAKKKLIKATKKHFHPSL